MELTDLARAMAAAAPRLSQAGADAAGRKIASGILSVHDADATTALALALQAVAPRMTRAAAPGILDVLAKPGLPLGAPARPLARSLEAVVLRMDPEAAAATAPRIVERMLDTFNGPFLIPDLAPVLDECLGRLDDAGVAAVVARRAILLVDGNTDYGLRRSFAQAFQVIAPRLDQAGAAAAARRLLAILERGRRRRGAEFLAETLAAIAPPAGRGVEARQAAAAAQRLLDAADQPGNPFMLAACAKAFGALTARLDAAAAGAAAMHLVDMVDRDSRPVIGTLPNINSNTAPSLVQALSRDRPPAGRGRRDGRRGPGCWYLVVKFSKITPGAAIPAQGLAALVPRLSPAAAASTASRILDLLTERVGGKDVVPVLAPPLGAIAARMEPAEGRKLAADAALRLLAAMAPAPAYYTGGLEAVAPQLDAAGAAAVVAAAGRGFPAADRPRIVIAVIDRMDPADARTAAAAAAQQLLDAMAPNSREAYQFDSLPRLLDALAARMDPAEAARTAAAAAPQILERVTSHPDNGAPAEGGTAQLARPAGRGRGRQGGGGRPAGARRREQ